MKTLILAAVCLLLSGYTVSAKEVTLEFQQTLPLADTEAPYRLSMKLTDVTPTRIGVEALLDMRKVQAALSKTLAGTSFADGCKVEILLDSVDATAKGSEISAQGRFGMNTYQCDRKLGQQPVRQEQIAHFGVTFAATASATVQDNCVYFGLQGVEVQPADEDLVSEEQKAWLQEARAIFLKASSSILRRTPICPELPPELSSIAPSYEGGGTTEIGDGGIGISLTGSVDVSTKTIVSILKVLQAEGVLPPAP